MVEGMKMYESIQERIEKTTYPASQTTVPRWKTTGFPDLSTSTPEIWPKSYSSNGQPSTSSGCEISSAIYRERKEGKRERELSENG